MKFRKKPVEIEAIQFFDGSGKSTMGECLEFIGVKGGYWSQEGGGIIIFTLEGNHLAKDGDWIIKGVKGEFYPCKPDIFEMTYEAVSPQKEGKHE